jgi:hypothetical protein
MENGTAKLRKSRKETDHTGSAFDSFLEEEGIREEVEGVANKRVLAWQLKPAILIGGSAIRSRDFRSKTPGERHG